MITNHGGEELTGFIERVTDKDLNKNIQNLMEKENIKKVIDEYYVHLQLYDLLGFSKLEQIKGMRKKNLENF